MAGAGGELADALEDRLVPRPCAVNRTTVLELVLFERDLDELEFIREQAMTFDDQDSEKVREIHQAIEQRMKDLQRIKELKSERGSDRPPWHRIG